MMLYLHNQTPNRTHQYQNKHYLVKLYFCLSEYKLNVHYSDATVNAFAFIVSRNVNGIWKRSTANLRWDVETAGVGSLFQYAEQEVIKTYGATPRKFLNNTNV